MGPTGNFYFLGKDGYVKKNKNIVIDRIVYQLLLHERIALNSATRVIDSLAENVTF